MSVKPQETNMYFATKLQAERDCIVLDSRGLKECSKNSTHIMMYIFLGFEGRIVTKVIIIQDVSDVYDVL